MAKKNFSEYVREKLITESQQVKLLKRSLLTAAERIAAQSELLSKRAEKKA